MDGCLLAQGTLNDVGLSLLDEPVAEQRLFRAGRSRRSDTRHGPGVPATISPRDLIGRSHLHVAAVCFVLATVVVPIVQRAVSPRAIDFAVIGALSMACYPRLRRSPASGPTWVRGIAILLALCLAQRYIR